MSVASMIYEVVYGVDLLDDLHNYFPALLYSQSRFITLTHVFHYVRHQMNRYFPGAAATTAATTAARVQATLGEASIILSLLGHIGAGGVAGANTGLATVPFSAPVIVAPTAEQIDAGSEIVSDLSGTYLANPCAICQDALIPNDICRRLRACGHVYHRSCIDQWYLRSVRCPTCRHDIREGAAPAPAPAPNDTVEPFELPPPL